MDLFRSKGSSRDDRADPCGGGPVRNGKTPEETFAKEIAASRKAFLAPAARPKMETIVTMTDEPAPRWMTGGR